MMLPFMFFLLHINRIVCLPYWLPTFKSRSTAADCNKTQLLSDVCAMVLGRVALKMKFATVFATF